MNSCILILLLFCAISAWNARATFFEPELRFEYHNAISWLPQSYDQPTSWKYFWMYSGFACFYWTARDYLLGKSNYEQGRELPSFYIPRRLQLLLILISTNGALIAIEAIAQRASGQCDLLWLRRCYWGNLESCFGPFSYRTNAGTFLNLCWPIALGLWWYYQVHHPFRRSKRKSRFNGPHLLLLNAAIICMLAVVISLSRGAVLMMVGLLALTTCWLLSQADRPRRVLATIVLSITLLGALAWLFDIQLLQDRFASGWKRMRHGREDVYLYSRQIAADYPVFGTGPGSFAAVYGLYRGAGIWQASAHDDWLETRITFGRFGFSLVCLSLGLLLIRPFFASENSAKLAYPIWIALAGVLIHAKVDLPLQVPAILLLTVILLAALSVSRR